MESILKRCTLVIPDAGPFNSLWVADQLPLLLKLDMKIVVVDAVYDELTSDLSYPKDCAAKELIDSNPAVFTVQPTKTGRREREDVAKGLSRSKNAGEVAMTDFISADDGLNKYLSLSDPVVVLFEDSDIRGMRIFTTTPNVHLLSTVALIRGMEKVGIVRSADAIIQEMVHPTKHHPSKSRKFNDLPGGIDEPAQIGSTWLPKPPDGSGVCGKCLKKPCECGGRDRVVSTKTPGIGM